MDFRAVQRVHLKMVHIITAPSLSHAKHFRTGSVLPFINLAKVSLYSFLQFDKNYKCAADPQLKVSITSPIYGVPFKGLYIEAYDLETHEKIGKFNEIENANVLLDGLAITHADRKDKEEAHFLWSPPADRHGEVYFR